MEPSAPSTPPKAASTARFRTLALNVKARIARIENPSDKGPHFPSTPATSSSVQPGRSASEQDRDYLSVKAGRPELPRADLRNPHEVEGEDATN